jgi:hypothetical protein
MLTVSVIGALWARSSTIPVKEHASMHIEGDLTKLRLSQSDIDALPDDVRAAMDESMDPCHDFYQFSWSVCCKRVGVSRLVGCFSCTL